ncbi:MAG: DUF2358 domain-containing protein [Leptolyngbya sp.]|nr:DUF2358 domain-containing protein [Leptolyngbya sp.]
MDILEQLRQDYQRFPHQQSYHLYAEDVYFKDPLNEFSGLGRYQRMIGFIARWFQAIDLQLHAIEYVSPGQIHTRWTLNWVAPLPWHPAMSISGRSELTLNDGGKICAHVDSWDCPRWAVLQQVFGVRSA